MLAVASEEVAEVEEIDRDPKMTDLSGLLRAAEGAGKEPESAEMISDPLLTPAAAPEALRRAAEAAAPRAADDDESIKSERRVNLTFFSFAPLTLSLFSRCVSSDMPSLSASLSSRRLLAAAPVATQTSSPSSPRAQRVAGPVVAAASALRPLSSSPLPASLRQLSECNCRRSLVVLTRSLKSDNAAETDWRVKEMMDAVRTYFGVWSGKVRKGDDFLRWPL